MVDVLGIKTWTVSIPGVKCGVPRRHLPPPFESRVKNPQYRALGPAKSLRFPRCLGHPTEGGNWSLATVLGSPEIGEHSIVLWGKKLESEGLQSHKLQKTGWIVIGMISGWEPTFLPLCFSKYVLFSFLSGGSRRRGQGCQRGVMHLQTVLQFVQD